MSDDVSVIYREMMEGIAALDCHEDDQVGDILADLGGSHRLVALSQTACRCFDCGAAFVLIDCNLDTASWEVHCASCDGTDIRMAASTGGRLQ